MKSIKLIPVLQVITILIAGCSHTLPKPETFLDRVTHIQDSIVTDIPQVPRLCDAMEVEKGYVDIGDCKLYYEIEGSGTPLVLIHGGPGGTHHIFHPWLSGAKKDFKIIYYDQRGCGLSDYTPGEGYSFEQTIADLEKLRQALKIDKWIVAGHSFGGGVAQYYTLKYPEQVIGQVLIGSVPMMNLDEFTVGRATEFYSEAETQKIGELRAMFRKGELTREQYLYNSDLNGNWKRGRFTKPTPEQSARFALYEVINDPAYNNDWGAYDFERVFETCPVPTLIVEGEYDLIWKAVKPEILKKYHPNALLAVIPASGHNIFADAPDRFVTVLSDWSKTIKQPGSLDVKVWQQQTNDQLKDQLKLINSSKSFVQLIKTEGIEVAQKQYQKIKTEQVGKAVFFEAAMNALGYEYLFADKLNDAITIFQMNVAEYPESWNTYDSLGEAYMNAGNNELAVENYMKSIELNPANENGAAMLKKLSEVLQ
ncbi:MAG: alpha/beta fold hydrolase [Candidatus Marinimicrobia bacterium]|nr:alpha/beta fold hydrolase [Candidatus Neomarinimicrobiota bacterium]